MVYSLGIMCEHEFLPIVLQVQSFSSLSKTYDLAYPAYRELGLGANPVIYTKMCCK